MTRILATPFLSAAVLALASCTASPPTNMDDQALVMQSLLTVLTQDGKRVCLDATTHGEPLAVFRTMMAAPESTRAALAWFTPGPLRPQGELSGGQIFDDQIHAERVVLATPRQSNQKLPAALQGELNNAAAQLALYLDVDAVTIAGSPAAPLATSRWWFRNRLDSSCSPVYSVSNPVVAKNVAFLSVTAGHWGTTYAFHKRGDAWAPVAQWTNWIY